MEKYKKTGTRILIAVMIMAAIMTIITATASGLTETGKIKEDMIVPIICIGIFMTGFFGSVIINFKKRNGNLVRGFITGMLIFGVPFLIGKTTSLEALEAKKSAAILLFSLIGSICGAVICNKKQSVRRR